MSTDDIPTHITRVSRVEQRDEHYFEFTVSGGLERYVSKGPDDFVYVLLPPLGQRELTIDESFTWTAFYEMTDDVRPVGAYYSVRRLRDNEMDIEVYLHEPAGNVSGWVTTCQPGDPVALWGPRTAWAPPSEVDWWLLVADETGVPALARIAEGLPAGAVVHSVVGPYEGLLEQVRALDFPEGNPYIWGGAESRAMTAIRRYVRNERGVPRERVSLTGYWRHPTTTDADISDED